MDDEWIYGGELENIAVESTVASVPNSVDCSMRTWLSIAHERDAFERWRAAQLDRAAEPAEGAQARGREVFLSSACVMCHTSSRRPGVRRPVSIIGWPRSITKWSADDT
jgi:hypothetical protein